MFGVALFYTLVVFNNVTHYNSNYQFIRHVLMMDSTFPGNAGMWRAVNSPAIHIMFYIFVIAWETLTMVLCWFGGVRLVRSVRAPAAAFDHAKRPAIAALTLGMFMWLVAFLSIGANGF